MAQPIDPRQVKPGRRWYVVAVAIAVLCVAGGVTGFVLGILSVSHNLPSVDHRSTDGTPASFTLASGHEYALWTSNNSAESCTLSPAAGATVTPAGYNLTVGSGSGWDWKLAFKATVGTTGRYSVDCHGSPYALGDYPRAGRLAGGVGFGLAALLGLPCFGLVLGTVIGVVAAIRRRGYRERLRLSGQTG